MTKEQLIQQIIADLGENYRNDNTVLETIVVEPVNDALYISNRRFLADQGVQIGILAPDIRKAVKSIYLQRGSEDTVSKSELGISSSYDDVKDRLRRDIIKGNKRVIV